MTAPITERTQSLIDYANDRRDTDYTNLTNIIENELDVDEQPPVEHIPSATLVEKAQSLIDYANGFFETDYDNLTDIILHDLKGQRTYSIEEKEPYLFRKSGGGAVVGDRERDKIVGGTVAWNQQVRDEASENQTDYADVVTVTDAVVDDAAVKVKVEPVQDLHGQESPWPAGGGANKLPYPFYHTTNTNNGITFTDNGDGSITINGTATGTAAFVLWNSVSFPAGQTISVASFRTGTKSGTVGIYDRVGKLKDEGSGSTITYADGYSRDIRINVNTGATCTDYTLWPMLVMDSTMPTAYSPYSNVCPIYGTSQIGFVTSGKNLLKLDESEMESRGWNRHFPFSIAAGTFTFTCQNKISASGTNGVRLTLRASDHTVVKTWSNSYIFGGTVFSATDTVTEEEARQTAELAIEFRAVGATWESIASAQIALNVGSTALPYEPYQGNTYTIEMPTEAGTVYGGVLTVNKDGSGSIAMDRINYEVDGTNNYFVLSGEYANISPYGAIDGVNATVSTWICNTFPMNTYYCGYNAGYKFVYLNRGAWRKIGSTSEELNAYAASHPIQFVIPLATPITYTLTASQVQTLLGTNNVWSDAGQVALTYTGTDEHLVLTTGRKYLTRISGTDSVVLGAGQEVIAVKGQDNVFDLTQMFGTAVADYVYQQGAGYFRRWFGGSHYVYNAGELLSVEGLQSHDTVGFNQWDEEWELGVWDTSGTKVSTSTSIRSKNYIPVIPNTSYYLKCGSEFGNGIIIRELNENKSFIATQTKQNEVFVTSGNTAFIVICSFASNNVTTYNNDICINLSDTSKNGTYEPYHKHSYPLDSSLTLRGIPKLDSENMLYYDGDTYESDGTVTRKYGVVDLGTISWAKTSSTSSTGGNVFAKGLSSIGVKPRERYTANNVVCDRFITAPSDRWFINNMPDHEVYLNDTNIFISASEYENETDFKTAMNGVYLVYELATPTQETAEPFTNPQIVDPSGTEEYVCETVADVTVPVGHDTMYSTE